MEWEGRSFLSRDVLEMAAYVPGYQPPPSLSKDQSSAFLKLNTNESPFPPSPSVIAAIQEALDEKALQLYPDPLSQELRQAIGESYALSAEHVLIGNGSDELLSLLFRAVLERDDSLLVNDPSYSLYPVLAKAQGAKAKAVALKKEDWHMDFCSLKQEALEAAQKKRPYKLLALANPNAPTGISEKREELLSFVKSNPGLSLVDEAYAPFMSSSLAAEAGAKHYPRLIVCGTFSKAYSLAGARVGWLIAHPCLIEQLDKLRDSYNVNSLSQKAALAAWLDRKEIDRRIQIICANRTFLAEGLGELGFFTLPSSANFLFTFPPPVSVCSAAAYNDFLEQKKVLVRYFPSHPRLAKGVRITISHREDMARLLACSREWLERR